MGVQRKRKNLRFFLAFFLLFCLASAPSAAAASAEQKALLREIEGYIKNYYLYPYDEEAFPLKSMDELKLVLEDPYSYYWKDEQYLLFEESLNRSIYGVGIYLERKGSFTAVASVVPGSPAHRAGIVGGDLIVAVDGRPVSGRSPEEVAALIRGEEGTEVILTILRRDKSGEQILHFALVREKIRLPAAEYSWEGSGIALVRIFNFGSKAARDMELILENLENNGLRGLILDLRGNSGGYLDEALQMASLFSGGVLLKVRDRSGKWEEISVPSQIDRPYPVILLINGGTASAAEIFAAALKDNRKALLLGEVTYGKGTMQSLFELENGGYLKLTVAEFASPAGRAIEKVGVEPHFLVPSGERQQQASLELLELWLKVKEEKGNIWDLLLSQRGAFTFQDLTPGELYLPLRAVLHLTGRAVLSGPEPGRYNFTWENRLYRLDIPARTLTWRSDDGKSRIYRKVFVAEGTTYLPASFFEEELGLKF